MTISAPTHSLTADIDVGSIDIRVLPGTLLANRYFIRELLGQGGQAWVFSALDLEAIPPLPVALKVARQGQRQGHGGGLHAEALLLQHIHETTPTRHVVRSLGTGALSANEWTFVVQELIDGPTLREVLAARRTFPVEWVIDIALGLARGLAAIHAIGAVHRDVKPSNIRLWAGKTPVLIDLGAAFYADEMDAKIGVMTRAYAAPEQLEGGMISQATDVYSLGIIIAEMATGTRPSHYAPNLRGADRYLARMIERCLGISPFSRPTANELIATLLDIRLQVRRRRGARTIMYSKACVFACSIGALDTNISEQPLCKPRVIADEVYTPFSPASMASRIFWSNISGKQILSAPISGGDPSIVAEMDTFTARIVSVDEQIYWLTNRGALWTLIGDDPMQLRSDTVAHGALPGTLVGYAGALYWSEASGTIRQWMIRDGTERELLRNSIPLWEIAVDDRHIYWTEHATHRVRRLSIEGNGRSELVAENQPLPDGIAVDETYVYWHNEGEGTIRRRPKAGGASETIVEDDVGRTRLVVDDWHLYWTSSWDGKIKRADKDGKNVVVLATGEATPIDLIVDENNLYWTTTIPHGRVMKCRK